MAIGFCSTMPRKTQREDILRLYDRGYPVPIEMLEHLNRELWKREGLQAVWQCKQGHLYKDALGVKAIQCGGKCGKVMTRIWSRRKGD